MNKKTVYAVLIIVLNIAAVTALYGDNGINPEQKADLPEASEGTRKSSADPENTVSLMAGVFRKER